MDSEPTRFLIIRLSAIGDILHATAVAHNLRLARPDAHITWLASPPASILLSANPDIDELLVWDRRPLDQAISRLQFRTVCQELRKLRKFLNGRRFDIVLDIHCLFLTGLIAHFTHTRRCIGIRDLHEFNHIFMTQLAPKLQDPHKIRRYLSVLTPLGIPAEHLEPILTLPSSLDGFAEDFFARHEIRPGQPILMVAARTTRPNKNWPLESFAAALSDLPKKIQIIFCGSAADQPYIRQIQDRLPRASLSIAGTTNLLELAALFRASSLLLSGDTGPLQIAAASGLPTLSLWGPTPHNIFGPLRGPHRFILSPHSCTACRKDTCRCKTNACINAISPKTVAQALQDFFQPQAEPRP